MGAFKLVVSYEQDRRENDARIEAVVLAQADLMRVLLEYVRSTMSSVAVHSNKT